MIDTFHKLPYGGPGGHCPRVLNPFQSTSYNHNFYLRLRSCLRTAALRLPFFARYAITNLPARQDIYFMH